MDTKKLERLAAPAAGRKNRPDRSEANAKPLGVLGGPTNSSRARSTARATAIRLADTTIGTPVARGNQKG